ncbi:MAG: hypothetical protein Q8O38_01555 [Sulfurimicrobium sp.]|nr:hypothetical protein [Sulfurimicrobium sp.]
MRFIKFSLVFFCLIWTTNAFAEKTIGFGLSQKYCLGNICLGDPAADHPELNAKSIFGDMKRISIPTCYSSTFSTPLYDFRDGSLGEFIIQNDPANPDAHVEKYYRVQSIRIRFNPPLAPDVARNLEQGIVNRYRMKKDSFGTFILQDGKRKIYFTDNGATTFSLYVTGMDDSEYAAQPGCTRKAPKL